MTEELHPVVSCPGDADSWLKAGIRLKCPNDKFGRNLYQCAPKEDKTDLVEFCLKGSIGRFEEGLCLFAYPNRYIDAEKCTTFEYGCPEKSYTSNEIYNHAACLEINREAGCYLADPSCPIDRTPVTLTGSSVSYQDGLGNVTSATTNFTTQVHSNPRDFLHVTAAVASSLSVIGIVFGIFLFFWCRRRVRWKRRQGYFGEGFSLGSSDYGINLDHSRWKTATSEIIGSLADGQKCILYSLLGYDDNKISWSDSEQWLSTLNDIRGTLFGAGNVSVKDIENYISELMRMNLVQNNQHCLRIPSTDYAEDVMYQLWRSTESKFEDNYSFMLTVLCVMLVKKYCVTTYPDKKRLQCEYGLSPSLVYRLQMDILTYPTMEKRHVRNAASWILNIPEENLQSQERRTYMHNDLRSKIDKGDVRKLGAVSWTRMTREYRGQIVYELRPQCVRSTIGRHDHNDTFIVEGDMYAQKDEFCPVNGDIEDLYAVLLSDKFSVPFDRQYLFDGITQKTEDVVRFVSDKIRRQIMFSYVVRKLLTDDDMKTFIKNASVDCLMEYGRLWRYKRREGEPCLFIPQDMEKHYLEKIGYVAMKHVLFNDKSLWESAWKEISKMNDVPFDLCIQSGEIRNRFVEYVRNEQKNQGYDSRSPEYLYSAFLFHKNGCKSAEYLEKSTWPILLTILMSDGYQIKNNFATIPRVMGRFLDMNADHFTEALKQIRTKEDVFKVSGEQVTFASPEIKIAVMSRFVESCLKSDEDLETYIEGSCRDSLMEYCRHWDYKRDEGEACVYIPQKFIDKYIKRLDAEVIIHVMVEDREDSDGKEKFLERRQNISKLLNIPLEVLSWNIDGRRRYLETIKLGRKKIYRARGMLVGCTGAGKTTLLRRLQGKTTAGKQQRTETTLGLEVYENLFEIVSDTLKDYSKSAPGFHTDKQLISMTDFAGQAAYYACHQVYLSRRAFYLLLVDMSKGLKKEAHKDNTDRHNPIGSLFHHWTYGDYFTFWLQCIQTYCEDGNEKKDRRNPVIVIASHKDKDQQFLTPGEWMGPQRGSHFYGEGKSLAFFEKLKKSIPQQQALKNLLSPDRYFEVECPPGPLRKNHEQMIEKVKKCIVETVQRLPHWGEEIPLSWAAFEDIFKERKNEKVWRRSKLREMKEVQSMTELKIDDMLRFFHEIGQIIYFADEKLRHVIIIDVQWFVDGFKNVIADENNLARQIKDCDENIERGKLSVSTLKDIWEKADTSYLQHMLEIVPFMEKLGLMVEMKANDEFYIPSMNRVDTSRIDLETISSGQKTSVLIFHFKTYLPHFFFFRLVARCFSEWSPLRKDMFYKNSAFYKDGNHSIAIAVNKTSIQLQIFTGGKEINLKTELVIEIRNKVDRIISELTETFHNKVAYGIGYACKDIQITEEDKDYFFAEKEILPVDGEIYEQVCPRHPRADEKHFIKAQKLLRFWNGATVT